MSPNIVCCSHTKPTVLQYAGFFCRCPPPSPFLKPDASSSLLSWIRITLLLESSVQVAFPLGGLPCPAIWFRCSSCVPTLSYLCTHYGSQHSASLQFIIDGSVSFADLNTQSLIQLCVLGSWRSRHVTTHQIRTSLLTFIECLQSHPCSLNPRLTMCEVDTHRISLFWQESPQAGLWRGVCL